jgi:hypothetical protein
MLVLGTLNVVAGRTDCHEYQFSQKSTVVGSEQGATVKLHGWFAPKVAALSGRPDEAYDISAVQGRKKVVVNDSVVKSQTDLKDGDRRSRVEKCVFPSNRLGEIKVNDTSFLVGSASGLDSSSPTLLCSSLRGIATGFRRAHARPSTIALKRPPTKGTGSLCRRDTGLHQGEPNHGSIRGL